MLNCFVICTLLLFLLLLLLALLFQLLQVLRQLQLAGGGLNEGTIALHVSRDGARLLEIQEGGDGDQHEGEVDEAAVAASAVDAVRLGGGVREGAIQLLGDVLQVLRHPRLLGRSLQVVVVRGRSSWGGRRRRGGIGGTGCGRGIGRSRRLLVHVVYIEVVRIESVETRTLLRTTGIIARGRGLEA